MDNEPDLPTLTRDAGTPAPTEIAQALRRLPVRLLNAAALLSSTAMVAAIETKMPPYKGD
jgi:hypothetical protein